MEILRLLKQESLRGNKPFIVIGGHAVNAHGISRSTGDLDLMIPAEDAEFWKEVLSKLQYLIRQESTAFVLSNPPDLSGWPIDFMLVSRDTFTKAIDEAMSYDHGGVTAPTASIQHLIAMKLHALKSGQPHREGKDFGDLVNLLKVGKFEPRSDQVRQIFLKYGTIEIYERVIKAIAV